MQEKLAQNNEKTGGKKKMGNAMKTVKNMALGAAVGVTAGVVGSKMMNAKSMSKGKKMIKKKATKALDTMGNMIDTASYMFK